MDYDRLWQEIAAIAREQHQPTQLPHEKSLKALMREWKLTRTQAEAVVADLLAQGKIKQRRVRCSNGKEVTVYSPL